MADACNISVVVVSHNRPDHLTKMLGCLRLQDISGFEVIVVSNTPLDRQSAILPDFLSEIPFSEANIAKARNLGIKAAKGDFIAFCDDDALPDPGWLRLLMAPFVDPHIGGAGGFTRGRNGISRQWGAVLTDGLAAETRISITETMVFDGTCDLPPVMIGTNCAFRKSALSQIGGFDPAFSYFLDDSDISFRLSKAGWKLAVVPDCQVHHNFAQSANRTDRRVPKSLTDLGRSFAYYCRKNGDAGGVEAALSRFRHEQSVATEKLFLLGLLSSDSFADLKSSLEIGFDAGLKIPIPQPVCNPMTQSAVIPKYAKNPQKHIVLAAFKQAASKIESDAKSLVDNGFRVTVIVLEKSPKFMQVGFQPQGYWQHLGGLFGRIRRSEPLWRKSSFSDKIMQECIRISETRSIDFVALHQRKKADASILPQKFGKCSLKGYTVLDDSEITAFLKAEL